MRTVLLIEDDPEILEFERVVLSMSGYDVLIATNGREGIETLRTCRPAAIVLDLMMPVMDGLTFLAERARQHLAEGVPVICVSAAGADQLARAAIAGAAQCISKPTDADELSAAVDHYALG